MLEQKLRTAAYQKQRLFYRLTDFKKIQILLANSYTLKIDITTHFNRCNISVNARLHNAAGHFCALFEKVFSKAQQTPTSALDKERKGRKDKRVLSVHSTAGRRCTQWSYLLPKRKQYNISMTL